jgi:hypothetical protein
MENGQPTTVSDVRSIYTPWNRLTLASMPTKTESYSYAACIAMLWNQIQQRPAFTSSVNHCMTVRTDYSQMVQVNFCSFFWRFAKRIKVMNVGESFSQLAIAFRKIEFAIWYLADQPLFCVEYCSDLSLPERPFSLSMKNK